MGTFVEVPRTYLFSLYLKALVPQISDQNPSEFGNTSLGTSTDFVNHRG